MDSLITVMQEAEFYPHEVTLPIEVIQTHISYVFLTGNYAYKLKKTVNFGFLDFSTLSQRKHFLEEELRLNQSLAKELYLEVLPISQTGEGYQLGVSNNPVEYVLKMRQFPQESLFIELFNAGKLTDNHIIELGKLVADFHQKAETNDYIQSFGTIDKIKESINNNYQQTVPFIGMIQTQEDYEITKNFTDQFLITHQQDLLQRIEKNKIKECHGDLHLQNICYWNNHLYLFDRIEFNEPFRFVDTMYDIGFAVMDLDAKNRSDLGNLLLNIYLEETGDWEGVKVLPLYLCRQAYVRAKVTSFLINDPNISPEKKKESINSASHYYQLAKQYSCSKTGKIIIMSGLSGSGKSTVARELAKRINAIHLRSDALRKHLGGVNLQEKGDSSLYSAEKTHQTYKKLLELGISLAKQQFSVILDARFDQLTWRQNIYTLCLQYGIPFCILHCFVTPELLVDRLRNRCLDISDATPDLIPLQIKNTDSFTPLETTFTLPLNTSVSLAWKTITDYVNQTTAPKSSFSGR